MYAGIGCNEFCTVFRYGIRLGDLKENWFLCLPIKHSTHTEYTLTRQEHLHALEFGFISDGRGIIHFCAFEA